MMDPQTAYFFKKFYRNVIKWWFVEYNPDVKRIWPSKEEEEAALQKEKEEAKSEEESELEDDLSQIESVQEDHANIPDDAYNKTTGSFSGLYGQRPVDDNTQAMLNEIMNKSSSQSSIDSILLSTSSVSNVVLPPEQEEIMQEANAIYERLLREAQEDEDRKIAEIEAAKHSADADT